MSLDIVSSVKVMLLPCVSHPGLKMDSAYGNQQCSSIREANKSSLHPKLIECMGICVLSQMHGSELRASDVYLNTVKNLYGHFSLHSGHGTYPWTPFCLDFSGFVCLFVCFLLLFWGEWEGCVWGILFMGIM